MKKLIIIRGISGTGKSKLAKKFSEKYQTKAYSTDDYFMINGQYKWSREKLIENHRKNIDRVVNAMKSNNSVIIVDNTNARAWEMKTIVEPALKYNYEIEIVEPSWSKQLKDNYGKWNIDFIEKLQKNPDRIKIGKHLERWKLENMADKYDYDVTVSDILKSNIPTYVLRGWKKLGIRE